MAKRLRKINIFTAAETDNAASFINTTSDNLNIRKIVMSCVMDSGGSDDEYRASLDEVPTDQSTTNDSRAHILVCGQSVEGTAGNMIPFGRAQLEFERGQLVLEPDEALYLNVTIASGATGTTTCNVWYED